MKKIITIICFAAAILSSFSCKKEDPIKVTAAIVTVKTAEDQSCFLQLDNETVLFPTNESFKTNPFKKNVRAQVLYQDLGELDGTGTLSCRKVKIETIDTILTKKPVEKGEALSNAGIEIYSSWMTNYEDGYLTLYFEGLWGTSGIPHIINLEKTDEQYTFILDHYNPADAELYRTRGLIAFDLNALKLPTDKDFDLILKYKGYTEDKTVTFHCENGTSVDNNGVEELFK